MRPIGVLLFVLSLFTFNRCSEPQDCGCDPPTDLRPMSAQEEAVATSSNNFAFDLFFTHQC